VRSLQVKFSALVVAILVIACVALAWVATQHERRALVDAAERRGRALVENLASDAKEPLLANDELRLTSLTQHTGAEEGIVAARLLRANGYTAAALDPTEQGQVLPQLAADLPAGGVGVQRSEDRLLLAAPVSYSGVLIGEAQLELDLGVLVEPVVAEAQRQLSALAVAVTALGVGSGIAFVALLVGPLRRLRAGVERLSKGDLAVRVPPTSQDEVGELTRAFNEMGESLQQKERIQSAFGRYVSDYVLNQLLETGADGTLGGTEREVTILFADIRRFTRLSEGMKASDVVALLNEVFQLASDRILEHGGTIDKFIGDSVMAYFGAPVPDVDHPLQATRAAVAIQQALAERNSRFAPDALHVEIGVGIHTGVVVVGTIGSDRRSDFTAIGDAVNVAHRLEKLARPSQILVSEAVQRRVRAALRLRFEGERQLSGRLEPVHVYSVELEARGSTGAPQGGVAGTAA
jgi:adenylate cyclase